MIINNENDVRSWIRSQFDWDCIFLIEPKSGGTMGMPDCLIFDPNPGFFLNELKAINNCYGGRFRPVLRKTQIPIFLRFADNGMKALLVVGCKKTGTIWACTPTDVIFALDNQCDVGAKRCENGSDLVALVSSGY